MRLARELKTSLSRPFLCNVRDDRGEIVTLLAFLILTALLLAGGIALSISVQCDPKVQRCVEPPSP